MNTFRQIHYSAQNAQDDGRLRQAQLKMLNMLKVVHTICLKHNLQYWLDGGTLLGAIRHHGFIPWDDDLDISMTRESYQAFLQIAPLEVPQNMWIQTAHTDPGYFNLCVPMKIRDRYRRLVEWHESGDEPYQQGIFIDVFVYDKIPDNILQRKLHKFLAKKIMRLLGPKYCSIPLGHRAYVYRTLGQWIPVSFLEKQLQSIIRKANEKNWGYFGNGYDSVNSQVIQQHHLFPLQSCRFESGEFMVPNHAQTILAHLYGDFWTLPPLSQRVMTHCKELVPTLWPAANES